MQEDARMASDFSRRTLIQSTAAVAATTVLSDIALGASPPALDLEEFVGTYNMDFVRSRYADEHCCQGVG
jgi:hypothetical protein